MSLLTPEVQALAKQSVLCWLATVDAHGQPNVSPKEVWAVRDASHIVVANIASPRTQRNIHSAADGAEDGPEGAAKVCLSFIDIFAQKGFKVTGMAKEVLPSSPDFARWAQPLLAMVAGRFQIRSVWVVKANAIAPILAPSYVFYPEETTESAQLEAALRTYGVQRSGRSGQP